MFNGWRKGKGDPSPTLLRHHRLLCGELNRGGSRGGCTRKKNFLNEWRWRYRNFSIQVAIQFISIPLLLLLPHSFYNHYFYFYFLCLLSDL